LSWQSIADLLGPKIILWIAQPEGEYGVGQLPAMAVARMHPNEYRSVATTLNITRIELRGMHGVVALEG
jgi:hypothetical protein